MHQVLLQAWKICTRELWNASASTWWWNYDTQTFEWFSCYVAQHQSILANLQPAKWLTMWKKCNRTTRIITIPVNKPHANEFSWKNMRQPLSNMSSLLSITTWLSELRSTSENNWNFMSQVITGGWKLKQSCSHPNGRIHPHCNQRKQGRSGAMSRASISWTWRELSTRSSFPQMRWWSVLLCWDPKASLGRHEMETSSQMAYTRPVPTSQQCVEHNVACTAVFGQK